jgi:hypothetical protein
MLNKDKEQGMYYQTKIFKLNPRKEKKSIESSNIQWPVIIDSCNKESNLILSLPILIFFFQFEIITKK